MMNLVIDKFVEVLLMAPTPVLASGNVGLKKPSGSGDVPAIFISLNIESNKGNGIGRFIRAGDTIAKNTNVTEVKSSTEAFLNDFKLLRLWPLPLKKNPSSVEEKFTELDVQVKNVTDPNTSVDYRMVDEPIQKEEFKLDVPGAQIIFGQTQTEGDKIEIVHWTVTWRNEILGERYSGLMILEIWTNGSNEVDEVSRRLQNKLKSNQAALRQKGFLKLQPAGLESIENKLIEPPTDSFFSVWKQKLKYKFVFEAEEGGELSSGVPIKRIDVDMNDNLAESFIVPK